MPLGNTLRSHVALSDNSLNVQALDPCPVHTSDMILNGCSNQFCSASLAAESLHNRISKAETHNIIMQTILDYRAKADCFSTFYSEVN